MPERPQTESGEVPAQSAIHALITYGEIDEQLKALKSNFAIDLQDVKISIVKPGDDLFDQYEIQHKLLQKCNSDFEQYLAKISSHGYDPGNISIEDLRDIANKEAIILDGNMPGFVLTAGDDEIILFAVNDSNAMEMAARYAVKENEPHRIFTDTSEAVEYLKSLAKKSLLHEIAHVIYSRGKFDDWEAYIAHQPDIRRKVEEIQQDKYVDAGQIPIAEEAFADFAVEVLSNGRLISRLGQNEEATKKVQAYLMKNLKIA